MASKRNTILAAAAEEVTAVGLRRTSLTDVARRAGVSRMTVYREYGDAATLFRALLTSEIEDVVAEAEAEAGPGQSGRARIVTAVVAGSRRLAGHQLFRRVLDLDPELVLPMVVDRLGSGQLHARERLVDLLRLGMAEGSVRALDVTTAAHVVLLTAQSFVFSSRISDADLALGDLWSELAELLDRYLAPSRTAPTGAAQPSRSPDQAEQDTP